MKRTRKDEPTRPEPHLACTADQFKALVRANWSEAEFQRQVMALAKLHGWRRAHFHKARLSSGEWLTPVDGDGKGFPDILLVKRSRVKSGVRSPGRMLFVELKTETGRLTQDQQDWHDDLNAAGATAVVWRPRDWDLIVRELQD